MRVADETELLEALEDADELAGVGVDVVREDVFIDRPARRCVNGDEIVASASAPADCR